MIRCACIALVLAGALWSGSATAAVVLVYHHVSDQTPPSTSVTPARFAAHLDYLDENDFEVWPVERLLAAAIDGAERLPERVVAITFDDAYASVHRTAWPMLRERGWPFAVFANTDAIDAGHAPYMDWEALRELHNDGANIGNHSASHAHLIARQPGESARAWRERVRADLDQARQRISEEIGLEPEIFAYPYGEDSSALARLVGEDHEFALVQRSGAVGAHTDPLTVPRFPMASGFDSMERFRLAVHSRALPVTSAEASPPGDGVRDPVQSLRLILAEGDYRAGQIACFSSAGARLETRLAEGPPHRLDIAVDGQGSVGRNKINCTAPAADGSGDFFWYSFQWVQEAVLD
ncbi:polysaccharide deacetylase family protein [Wenzhouxiangella limi]|uniref:Polysaccharide deacetylase family protein n=1 Tax=Wenzhouxiangella limi TaxID=2707351 RepID=A0A845UTN4_9GAMM|nr:polysaccharide deacetylase family protein [Wenzhouxiangella limi]NDY95183.1 polysaccharide deacetylase family protein [Wenzhouxiangella limi]